MNVVLDPKDKAVSLRILQVFEQRAAIAGPKQVVMTVLAKALSMSTKTLYRHFPNKAALVQALIGQWNQTFLHNRSQRLAQGANAHERIRLGALEWLSLTSRFSDAFWLQIERDYPQAFAVVEEQRQAFLLLAQQALLPEIRSPLNGELALLNLWQSMNQVPSVKTCERLNITRQDALVEVVDVWARGALKQYQ